MTPTPFPAISGIYKARRGYRREARRVGEQLKKVPLQRTEILPPVFV